MGIDLRIECDECPAERILPDACDRDESMDSNWAPLAVMQHEGWTALWISGRWRVACPICSKATAARSRAGFTLVELLVVLVIVSIIAVVTVPAVLTGWARRSVDSAAQLVRGEVEAARARAQTAPGGLAGIRLIPDPSFPLARLADGSIDPTAVLVYDQVVPLIAPPGYQEGRVSIHATYPAAFASILPAGRLVLEQQVGTDAPGPGGSTVRIPLPPTSWAWNVRLGDRIQVGPAWYSVVGPMAVGPDHGNVELFINYTKGWLDAANRGDGQAEFLLLTDLRDDDGDGWIDNGADGADNDGDGLVDEADEWTETEVWGPLPVPSIELPYTLRRKPAPAPGATGVRLAGAVVDATGWDQKTPPRSVLPVDRWTGQVDLLVDASGVWSRARSVGVPTADGLRARWWHLWIADRSDVAAPVATTADGMLATIDARTGRTIAADASGADPEGSRARAEGRGR